MWNEPIDIYCERLDVSFWAEPLNTITNLAFIIASITAIYIHKKEGLNNKAFVFLSSLVGLIGFGSFLFHTFANRWSEFSDIIPIWSFVVLYILFVIRLVFKASWFKTFRIMTIVFILAYLGFLLSQTNTDGSKPALNGSLQYAPALFFMIVFSVSLYLKRRTLFVYSFIAVIVFLISLLFRTIDVSICDSLSVGTHFIWHILNAVMLFLLLYVLHKAIKEDSNIS